MLKHRVPPRSTLAPLWTLGLLLAVTTVGCSAPTATAPTAQAPATRYTLDAPQQWPADLVLPLHAAGPYRHLDIAVNGQPTGRFLLDTGANRPVIDTGRANRLNLPDVGGGTTTGIAGPAATRYRQADSLRLGPAALPAPAGHDPAARQTFVVDTPAARMIALPMRGLSGKFSAGVGGILCFRTLQSTPFTIHPQDNTLTLHRPQHFRPPDADDPNVTRVRLRRFHGLPVVDATLFTDDQQPVAVRLILDTGMNTALSLPDSLLRQHPTLASVPVTGAGLSSGIGGTLQTTKTWARNTRVFNLDLRNLPVAFEPMPAAIRAADGLPQGRLGMGVLGHFELTFDATRNYLYARYLGNPTTTAASSTRHTDLATPARSR